MPAHSRIISHPIFEFLLDLEIAKAQRLQYYVSVVSMRPDQERHRAQESITWAAANIVHQLRATDVVTLVRPDTLALMVIDADTRSIPSIVNRLTDRLPGVQEDLNQMTWSIGAACYPSTITETGGIMRQATDLMTRARHDGGDRLYLPG